MCKFITCYDIETGVHNVIVTSKYKTPDANMLLIYGKPRGQFCPPEEPRDPVV